MDPQVYVDGMVEGSKVTLVMGEETLLADIAANGGLSIRGTPFAKSLPFQ